MSIRRANVLDEVDVEEALQYIRSNSQAPERDTLFILLGVRLGLRANEIANVYAEDVLDARGALKRDVFFVSKRGAKYGKARTLPMRNDVYEALDAYMKKYQNEPKGPLFTNQYGQPASSDCVQKQIARIYAGIGLQGCSSHSGRRTFGTRAAKRVAEFGGSLRNVQRLLGHSDLKTTEAYIDYTADEAALVAAL